MPGITPEQRTKFVQKYNHAFDDEIVLDEGLFQGLKVKDAEHIMAANLKGSGSMAWLLAYMELTMRDGSKKDMFDQFYKDTNYTWLAIRFHIAGEGCRLATKITGKSVPGSSAWTVWQDYGKLCGYVL